MEKEERGDKINEKNKTIINMKQDDFQKQLLKHSEDFRKILETPSGDWSVKGFIDIAKNIYTISVDTKVISKY